MNSNMLKKTKKNNQYKNKSLKKKESNDERVDNNIIFINNNKYLRIKFIKLILISFYKFHIFFRNNTRSDFFRGEFFIEISNI